VQHGPTCLPPVWPMSRPVVVTCHDVFHSRLNTSLFLSLFLYSVQNSLKHSTKLFFFSQVWSNWNFYIVCSMVSVHGPTFSISLTGCSISHGVFHSRLNTSFSQSLSQIYCFGGVRPCMCACLLGRIWCNLIVIYATVNRTSD